MTGNFEKLCKVLLLNEGYYDRGDQTVGLSGEYWFDQSGSTMYADGDNGDMNHEAYVIQRCNAEVLDYFHLNSGDDDSVESHEDDILKRIVDEMDIEDEEERFRKLEELNNDPADAMMEYLKQHGAKNAEDLVLNAYGSRSDAREFAIKYWGWSRVAKDSIETKELTSKTLQVLARGINNALEEEGKTYEYEDNPDILDQHEYNISTYTGKRYRITLQNMDSGNVEGLERGDIEQKTTAATQQVKQMDMEQMPDYYRQRGLMGDSYVINYLEKL